MDFTIHPHGKRGSTMRVFKTLHKAHLRIGDLITVETTNSTYVMRYLGDDMYAVMGGHFTRMGMAPFHTPIEGISLGRQLVDSKVVVAHGYRLNFNRKFITSTVRRITVNRSLEEEEHS